MASLNCFLVWQQKQFFSNASCMASQFYERGTKTGKKLNE